jgi:hypothetical protein
MSLCLEFHPLTYTLALILGISTRQIQRLVKLDDPKTARRYDLLAAAPGDLRGRRAPGGMLDDRRRLVSAQAAGLRF